MKSLAPSAVTHRDPKGLKFMSIVEAAFNKAELTKDEAQRVNDTPGLPEVIADFIAKHRFSNKYKDEEVKSSYVYPKAYKPKSIVHQIKILHEMFPDVDWKYFRPDEEQIVVPPQAEGLFAIPRWQTLGATYQEALEKVLAKIKETRTDGFVNYREGALGSENIRLTERTKAAFEKLEVEQADYDILVVPIQFGLRHRGRSVRRAREVFQTNEFGLDPFTVAIMILVHPERFTRYEDLCVDCAGAEYAPDADGDFSYALCFSWGDGRLGFDCHWVNRTDDCFGSASGFLGSQQ